MRRTYHTLDAMRGVAAAFIVILHGHWLFGWSPVSGNLAVDLFFVLSGFVMAHAYEDRLRGGMTTLEFLRIRVIRFWPLFLLGLLGGFVVEGAKVAIGYPTSIGSFGVGFAFVAGLLFLPGWPGERAALFPLNPPSWSLFFELVINGAFASLHRYLTNTVLIGVAALGAFGVILGSAINGGTGGGYMWHDSWLGLARVSFSFPVGVLLYRFRSSATDLNWSWGVPCIILGAFLSVSPGDLTPWFDVIFVLFVGPALVLMGSRIQPPVGARRICSYLGIFSYAIYITHYPLMQAGTFMANRGMAPPLLIGVAIIALLAITCPLLDRYYDRPMRRLLARLLPEPARKENGISVRSAIPAPSD